MDSEPEETKNSEVLVSLIDRIDPEYIIIGSPWVMRIELRRECPPIIRFNRKEFPNCAEDEFAERVMKALEDKFSDWLIKRRELRGKHGY